MLRIFAGCVQYHERLIGCTGSPADSHEVIWISASTDRPRHRCSECGSGETFNPIAHS